MGRTLFRSPSPLSLFLSHALLQNTSSRRAIMSTHVLSASTRAAVVVFSARASRCTSAPAELTPASCVLRVEAWGRDESKGEESRRRKKAKEKRTIKYVSQ